MSLLSDKDRPQKSALSALIAGCQSALENSLEAPAEVQPKLIRSLLVATQLIVQNAKVGKSTSRLVPPN